MKITFKLFSIVTTLFFLSCDIYAQNIYELRKFTNEDWIEMTTEDRIKALNVSINHPGNQTIMGDFGRYTDMYPRWGYDYYEMENRYETYAFRGFENYNIMEDRRSKWYYNQFGDRLTKMTRSARIWAETYYDDGTTDVKGPTGYINSYGGRSNSNGIWVVQESTNDWAISVVGANALRTKFTPLTLTIPNLSGMKADFQSANYEASIVNSIASGGGGRYGSVRGNTLLLRGGQLRRKFGALTLGANYVNMYARQVNREKGDIWKGTVSDNTPTPMLYAVRIMDDSPHDGNGPTIHDVKIKVDGVYRPDILPQIIIDDYRRELTTAVTSTGQMGYLDFNTNLGGERQNTDFTQLSLFERIPKFLDYMLLNDYAHGWNVKDVTENLNYKLAPEYYKYMEPGGKPFQVNGNEYVVYLFDLSSIKNIVKRVQAEITVSNDYRIQLAEIFTKKQAGGHSPKGEYFYWYNTSFWKTMAQAEGNIKDNSNLRTVAVDFAWEVGNTIYGFDAHFNYLGFKVDGEYVRNIHHYMFSDGIPGAGEYMIDPTEI